MACSTNTLKLFALIWDVIYAILGVGLIIFGIQIYAKFEQFHLAAFITLGLGIFILLAAAFGAFGAIRESSSMSRTYMAILIILMLFQILVIGFLFLFKTSVLINSDKTFDQLWSEQPLPVRPRTDNPIASIEKWLECCGNSGPKDYILPPYSCYNQNEKLNLDGCRQKFLDYISDRYTEFNVFALILVLVEFICAGFAMVLANSIINRSRRSDYYPK